MSSLRSTPLPRTFATTVGMWPIPVQKSFATVQTLFHDVAKAAEVGALDESLKWGQPAWRPRMPRIGCTLRLNWSTGAPDRLVAYVNCKTDIASNMQSRFPDLPGNDGRRALRFDVSAPDKDALWQLALLTFTYHRAKQSSAN